MVEFQSYNVLTFISFTSVQGNKILGELFNIYNLTLSLFTDVETKNLEMKINHSHQCTWEVTEWDQSPGFSESEVCGVSLT